MEIRVETEKVYGEQNKKVFGGHYILMKVGNNTFLGRKAGWHTKEYEIVVQDAFMCRDAFIDYGSVWDKTPRFPNMSQCYAYMKENAENLF